MDEYKSYQNSSFPPNYNEIQNEENDLPPYPQNPIQYEGYRNIGFCPLPEEPTISDQIEKDSFKNRPQFQQGQILSEDEAKEALANYVSEHCCYGKSPLKDLKIVDIKSSDTLRYILETFTETRTTQYIHEPYTNQPLIHNGQQPPHPWGIPINPTCLFNDQVINLEIPNTSHIETCFKCRGVGKFRCRSCNGSGRNFCTYCHGHGHRHHVNNERCTWCHGSGRRDCFTCARTGYITCNMCKGCRSLKWYLQLTVTFKTNSEDYIKKTENVPDDLLRKCLAKNIFSEQNNRVFAINHPNNHEINQASINLINKHWEQFNQSRILAQRHEVNSIPVTLATYIFKEKAHTYIIYGLENKVFTDNYPRKCLCCTIL